MPGLWLAETEGAKFWLSVLTGLKTLGLKDILITFIHGLKGFPDAIAAEYPDTKIQLCIVHMVRNSLRFVPRKQYMAVAVDLKLIYQARTQKSALISLDQIAGKWGDQFLQISKSWQDSWPNLFTQFEYSPQIRKRSTPRTQSNCSTTLCAK